MRFKNSIWSNQYRLTVGKYYFTMSQGKPDNLNVHNCHMSVPVYGAAIECDVRCVEISQLYDLKISSIPAIDALVYSHLLQESGFVNCY